MNGYDLIHRNRKNKKVGGVAIYVNVSIEFKVLQTMSVVIDDILACITVELSISNRTNIIVSCIYRAPGTSVDIFTDKLELLITTVKNTSKTIFLCGDFNTDLLKYSNNNKGTQHFVDMLFSLGIYILIDKPSRITDSSATLIDNIFKIELNSNTTGLLINDISDHLPIFCVCSYSDMDINRISDKKYRFIRKFNEGCIKSFNNAETDADTAYTNFIDIFTRLYDKNCPIKNICNNKPIFKNKPWFTRGL